MTYHKLPPEIVHEIVAQVSPTGWDWGSPLKAWAELKIERDEMAAFLNFCLVCSLLDDIVMRYFYATIVGSETSAELPLWCEPHTRSAMAMGKRLLRMLVGRGGARSHFLNQILLAIKGCEGLFSRTGHYGNTGKVREIYLNGILETYTGRMGNIALSIGEKEHGWMYVILIATAYLGRIEDWKHLMTLGLNLDQNHEGMWLYPPLIAASFGGQETAARVLIEHGADPHTLMRSNESSNENAIHFAALGGHTSLILLLVGYGVNPRLESLQGDTPLIWAAAAGHSDTVRIPLTYYIDVSEKRRRLEGALDWAAVCGYDDAVVEILKDPVTRYSHIYKGVWTWHRSH
ncbi:ankyrin repeat-containing domain protein, partial [Aspergillus carlsbadensis]